MPVSGPRCATTCLLLFCSFVPPSSRNRPRSVVIRCCAFGLGHSRATAVGANAVSVLGRRGRGRAQQKARAGASTARMCSLGCQVLSPCMHRTPARPPCWLAGGACRSQTPSSLEAPPTCRPPAAPHPLKVCAWCYCRCRWQHHRSDMGTCRRCL